MARKLTKRVLFHQDSAPAYKYLVAMGFVHDCGFELVDHPPYFPDLAASDYFQFTNMNVHGWEAVSYPDDAQGYICS